MTEHHDPTSNENAINRANCRWVLTQRIDTSNSCNEVFSKFGLTRGRPKSFSHKLLSNLYN